METPSQLKSAGAALLVLAALFSALVAFQPEGLKAPAWLAYLAAAILALAGTLALARAYGRHMLADGLACAVLGGMLLVGLWIALGPGPRQCVSRIPSTGALVSAVSETTCRSAFGFGALLIAGMLALAVRGWLRHRSAG
ncbi:hypothetical protein [Lysobacter humi (ex Lee et al. 2017)]